MLQFCKNGFFCIVIAVFMACSAPTRTSVVKRASVTEIPAVPEKVPYKVTVPERPKDGIAGMPRTIGAVIDSAPDFWAGSINDEVDFYLDRNGFDDEFKWRITLKRRDTGESQEFFARSYSGADRLTEGGIWSAPFYMRNPNYEPGKSGKILHETRREFTMSLRSLNEAMGHFNRTYGSSYKTGNYGSFGIIAM